MTTPKQVADSPPKPKSNEELLRRIIAESKCFRGPGSGKGRQSANVKRKGVSGVRNGDQQGRRGAV